MLSCGHPDECLGYTAGGNPGDPTTCLWCQSLREERATAEAKAARVVELFAEIAHETPGTNWGLDASGIHVYEKNEPGGCPVCEAIDAVMAGGGIGDMTTLTSEQRATLRAFRESGLLWLVNTSILHPRGYAIAMQLSDHGEPLGMMVDGDGVEPWAYDDPAVHESFLAHNENEQRREREWREARAEQ